MSLLNCGLLILLDGGCIGRDAPRAYSRCGVLFFSPRINVAQGTFFDKLVEGEIFKLYKDASNKQELRKLP